MTTAITAHWKNSPTRIAASYTFAQTFAIENMTPKEKIDAKDRVPTKYHKYLHLFCKKSSNRLPKHKPYDHTIDLIKDAKMTRSKVYPLSPIEQKELDSFIEENLAKGYIQPSKSPFSSPFFFVQKKDATL